MVVIVGSIADEALFTPVIVLDIQAHGAGPQSAVDLHSLALVFEGRL